MAPTQTPAEQYAANRRDLWSVTRTLAGLPVTRFADAAVLRAEQGRIYEAGLTLAAALPVHAANAIDDTYHAAYFPEWKAAKDAGLKFTQPGRKGNPWRARTSGRAMVAK